MILNLTPSQAKVLFLLLGELRENYACGGCDDFTIPSGLFNEDELEFLRSEINEYNKKNDPDAGQIETLNEGDIVSNHEMLSPLLAKMAAFVPANFER
ncbi:hypothetical protein [Vibrio sp. D431a]|uniref:hypothetical protein n=1 Tax=Vibrio sp. D431a TaxID=2837388 RepID=UPI0025529449|nr:hypothetical protein [Vibrio sp. D431a]MDK9789870.1 hypothetical protein [Vibrio sp. D431a]